MSRGFERGKRNAYRLLQAAQLFERMAITSSPMARRGASESDTMSSKTIRSNIQQPMTKQVKFGISEVEDENEAFNLALLGYTYAAYALLCIIYLAQSGACVTYGLHAGCLLQCVGSAKLQDVLMQCVFGSRKSKAWRPVLQVFKDHQRSLF